jgi:hypothetical protein
MIIIQYVENDSDLADGDSDSHLARLSYARMKEVKREEEHFGNITIRNGSPPIVTPSTSLGMINVCQRIQDHTPQQHTDHAPQQPSHTHSIERVDHTLSSGAETEESGSRSATPDDEVCENTSTVS